MLIFKLKIHETKDALCGKSNEKSSSAVLGGNFAIDMGVHPSGLQIKKKLVPIWSDLALK